MTIRPVKVVSRGPSGRDTDVFDLETGEKLTRVHSVELKISRGEHRVVVETSDPFMYEGPAKLITPEEKRSKVDTVQALYEAAKKIHDEYFYIVGCPSEIAAHVNADDLQTLGNALYDFEIQHPQKDDL